MEIKITRLEKYVNLNGIIRNEYSC